MSAYLATVGSVTVRVDMVREGAGERVSSPGEAGRYFLATAPSDGREHFRALYLDTRHKALGPAYTVSIGCLTASLVAPRELFRPAIVAGACGIIVSHNHPSGDPEPSADDLALTRRLAAAGSLLGIELLDHVITGGDRFVSLKDRGVL
jgi:DNA repair protein RadC